MGESTLYNMVQQCMHRASFLIFGINFFRWFWFTILYCKGAATVFSRYMFETFCFPPSMNSRVYVYTACIVCCTNWTVKIYFLFLRPRKWKWSAISSQWIGWAGGGGWGELSEKGDLYEYGPYTQRHVRSGRPGGECNCSPVEGCV